MNPYLEVIAASLVWGTAGVFVKVIDLPVTTIAFFRVAVPTVGLFGYFILKQKNLLNAANKMIVFLSILTALRMFLWFFGYLHTSIGNAVIILYTWPVFTVLFAPILIKEKLTKQKLLLSLIAFIGVVIVFANKEFSLSNKDFLGMSAMLASAALSAVGTILFKKQLARYSKLETIFYQNFLGFFIFLPFLFINTPFPTVNQVFSSIVYSLVIGLFAFVLWFSALKRISASTASLLSYVEVVSAIVLGVLVLKEAITWNMLVGGGIILVVSYFARKSESIVTTE